MRAVVVLPTYNEADNIEDVLLALLGLKDLPIPLDVIVVDDSSPDGTGMLVEKVGSAFADGKVRLLTRPRREGLAAAYRDGFRLGLTSGYDYLVQMDADLSHPAETVRSMLQELESGADLVLGSRYIPGGATAREWAPYRRALSKGGNLYARLVLGLPYKDLTGGFKAWRASTLGGIEPIGGDLSGYAFQIHATFAAHRNGATIVEVPFVFNERRWGISKMSSRIVLEAVVGVLRMRQRPPTGRSSSTLRSSTRPIS